MGYRLELAVIVIVTTLSSCSDQDSYLSYDTTFSGGGGDATGSVDDDIYPPIDSCYLAGAELSVFLAEVDESPVPQSPLDYCPEPPYNVTWGEAQARRIRHAVGPRPARDLRLLFLSETGINYPGLQDGDQLLIAARHYAPNDIWVVVESVGVTLVDDVAATTNTGPRGVDLPSSWSGLIAAIEADRGTDCGRMAIYGTVAQNTFEQNALFPGDLTSECGGYRPPDDERPGGAGDDLSPK